MRERDMPPTFLCFPLNSVDYSSPLFNEDLICYSQRGFNSKRGPRSFHPLLPLGFKRYIIAPKARQMSLKWESLTDESFKCRAAGMVQQLLHWTFT
jgi:hypothetical protein